MYNEKTIRKKAAEAGYRVSKGFSHYHSGGISTWGDGTRDTGYNVEDLSTGFLVWGCYDNIRDHIWSLEDVDAFLREEYQRYDLAY